MYDNGTNPSKQSSKFSKKEIRSQLGALIYNTNYLGMNGPKKFKVIIP